MKILIFGMGAVADTYLHTYEDVSMSVVGFGEPGASTCTGAAIEADIRVNLYTPSVTLRR